MAYDDEYDRLIRDPEKCDMIGLGSRQCRNLERQDPNFPKRVLIAEGGRAVAWSYREMQQYVRDRIALRAKPKAHLLPPRGGIAKN